MKKPLKVFTLAVAVLLMLSMLMACSTAAPSAPAASSAVPAASASATTQTPAPTKVAQTGKVTFYTISEWTQDPNLVPFFKQLTDKFAQDNPGCTAEVQSDPFSTWMQKTQVMLSSGNAPDVVLIANGYFPQFANAGYLMDMGPALGDKYFDDYVQSITQQYTWQGKHFAVPFTMDTRVLYYNKDLFTKAGLDPNAPPKTWDDLLADAKKLTMDTNGDGKADVYGFGLDLALKEFVQQAIFCASKGSILNVDANGTITPNVDTPEFRAYLKLLLDMKPYYQPDFATTDNGQTGTLFAQQKVAMITNGPWIFDQNKDMPATTSWVGQAMIPKMTADGPDGSYGAGFGIGIASTTKLPDVAVKLVKLIFTPDFNSNLMTNAAVSKTNLDASNWAKNPLHDIEKLEFPNTRQAQPKTLFYSQVELAEQDIVAQLLLGKITIDQAVTNLSSQITDIVSKK